MENKRNNNVDAMKLLLAIFVVGLHCEVLKEFDKNYSSFLVNGLFRIAVPIFMIANGFYYFNIKLNKKNNEWIKRVYFLYVFWMVLYAPFWMRSGISYGEVVQKIFFGYYHLWYVAGMIGAFYVVNMLEAIKKYSIFICVIFAIIGVLLQYNGVYKFSGYTMVDELSSHNFVFRNFILFSTPFFYIGYIFNKYKITIKANHTIFYLVIGVLAIILEIHLTYEDIKYSKGFNNYISLYIICPTIFLIANQCKVKYFDGVKNMDFIASVIFFTHPIFIFGAKKINSNIEETTLFLVALSCSVIFAKFICNFKNKLKNIF